jgi:hypothetical protein
LTLRSYNEPQSQVGTYIPRTLSIHIRHLQLRVAESPSTNIAIMAATTSTHPTPTAQPTADLTAAMANVSVSSPAPAPAPAPTPATTMRSSPSVRIATAPKTSTSDTSSYPTRKLVRRDSLDRREALLKGKEGSRQRRRWENGMFPISQ